MNQFDACMLLDFYGQLLTERTRFNLELHYSEDMSLAEIAEQEGISRQAVHDSIRRGLLSLNRYEDKLGLLERFLEQKNSISEALTALSSNDVNKAAFILTDLSGRL